MKPVWRTTLTILGVSACISLARRPDHRAARGRGLSEVVGEEAEEHSA
jgi:hypothetical protein